ncbi:EAL domain-containing protein [Arcobacter sp.]|uniref:EAL domain-containing protein n=1 Tax=Arcobacter sp. TaxID=1872629 RepID=UPI003D0A0F4A
MNNIKIIFLQIVDVIRASFISLVPYYILYSFLLLAIEILKNTNSFNSVFTLKDAQNIVDLITFLIPILINISISYHLASIYYMTLSRFLTIILSLSIYLSVEVIVHQTNINSYNAPHSIILAILIPLLSAYLLAKIIEILHEYQNKLNNVLSRNITTMIVYIIPFTFIFFVVTFIFSGLGIYLNMGSSIVFEIQESLLLFIRTIVSSFLWFFGIHGINFFDSIVNVKSLNNFMYPNFNYYDFFNLFVIFGGIGSGLSLVIAIFIASKDKHTSFIGKMSLPFVIFNINEILIFGIPIFMNFSLMIPFIFVPVINFILSYFLLSYTHFITFSDTFVPWTTPAILNIYLATNGNLLAVLFQVFLIILGTLIYIPFVKKYTKSQSSTLSLENLARKFDITTSIEAKQNIKFYEAQSFLVKSHYKINKIIEKINQNNLIVYYQPKINVQKNNCNEFEALLRIRDKYGNIKGPDFILDIENSGMSSILDIWVCQEVKKDLDFWAERNFYPDVSINLFPHTLEDKNYINQIIKMLKKYNVHFEIIERRSSLNKKIVENLKLLKENNFKISLDDLGIGFTNFSMLYEMPLDIVKIDKKIIEFTNTTKGLVLYNNICHLCISLNLQIVLEGVETKEEYERLMNKDINFIQGWYFSKAIPFNEVESFSKNFSLN